MKRVVDTHRWLSVYRYYPSRFFRSKSTASANSSFDVPNIFVILSSFGGIAALYFQLKSELKSDVKEKHDDIKSDVKEKHDDIKSDVKEKHDDIKSDVKDIKSDVKEKHDDLKADVKEKHEELKAKHEELKVYFKEQMDRWLEIALVKEHAQNKMIEGHGKTIEGQDRKIESLSNSKRRVGD